MEGDIVHGPGSSRRIGAHLLPLLGLAALASCPAAKDARADGQPPTQIERWIREEDYVRAFAAAAARFDSLDRRRGPLAEPTLSALHQLATIAHLSGDQDTAEHLAQISLDLRRRTWGEGDPRLAESWYLRGVIARYAQDEDLAWQCYERASSLITPARPDYGAVRADILQKRGSWLRNKDMDDAIDKYREALAVRRAEAPQDTFAIADNLVWLSWHLFRVGRQQEAEVAAGEAESILVALGLRHHGLMGTLHQIRGERLARAERWRDAEAAFEDACRAYENSRQGHFPGLSRRKSRLEGYRWLALCQVMLGKGDAAWQSMQRSLLNLSIEFGVLARWASLEPESYARYSALKRAAGRRAREINAARARGDAVHALEHWDAVRDEILALAELYQLEQGYLRRHVPAEMSLATVQAGIQPHQACIGWLEWKPRVDIREQDYGALGACWAYVLRDHGPVQWIPLWWTRDPREQERHEIGRAQSRAICERASGWRLRMENDPELFAFSRHAGGVFFEPLRSYLAGVTELIVELGWQHTLMTPLESMVSAEGSYLGDEFDVSYTFSAMSRWLPADSKVERHASALALSDPRYSDVEGTVPPPEIANFSTVPPTQLRKALDRDPQALDALPRLYFSAVESEAIQRLFPSVTVLRGAEANESRLTELADSGALAGYDVIHLASHALIDWIPERSALAVSRIGLAERSEDDGLIDAREIYLGWSLDAELLTLSGCQTAGNEWGFHQVLQAVGARCILASMWKVDDAATALLMGRFYEALLDPAHPVTKARALRDAKHWLRSYQIDGVRPFEHPAYWAPFILLGEAD